MADLDMQTETVRRIYEAWKTEGDKEPARRYLGASIVGNPCDMALFLEFRGVVRESFSGRMYRLFNRGQREEATFVKELRSIGCEVWEVDPETGAQWEVKALGGHFSGHLDGVCLGVPEAPKTPHVTEFKTHSDASFRKLQKSGVRVAKPNHYAQMMVYMGAMRLTRALYLAVDKDNDELYSERIEFSKPEYDAIMLRAKRIIETSNPERLAGRPDDFRCRFCPAHAVCWHTTGTVLSHQGVLDCRTCCHSTARTDIDGARWECRLGHPCAIGRAANCPDHLALPALVDADGIEDANLGHVTYRIGKQLCTNGKANGQFSSEELQRIGRVAIESGAIQSIKDVLPAAKVTACTDRYARYLETKPVFEGDEEQFQHWREQNPSCLTTVGSMSVGGVDYHEFEDGVLWEHDAGRGVWRVYMTCPF